jgi:hypothetical protein
LPRLGLAQEFEANNLLRVGGATACQGVQRVSDHPFGEKFGPRIIRIKWDKAGYHEEVCGDIIHIRIWE